MGGWSIQADVLAEIPDGLFLRDQEAKISESRRNAGMRMSVDTLACLMLNTMYECYV